MVACFFITGTDTGVGKTLVSCALLHAFATKNKKVVGMKPVASGCEDGQWQDVNLLATASSVPAPTKLINPYALIPPLAPHIAAKQAHIEIDLTAIRAAFFDLQQLADVIIIEGVGGLLVPFNDYCDSADLARMLNLPVIMVVGLRLGCLNHALLTAQAVHAKGLCLAGWVANSIDPHMLAQKENIQDLMQRLNCPLLGVIPYSSAINYKKAAEQLNLDKLKNVLFL